MELKGLERSRVFCAFPSPFPRAQAQEVPQAASAHSTCCADGVSALLATWLKSCKGRGISCATVSPELLGDGTMFLLFFSAYVVVAASLLFLALFGSMPVFAGTPVAAAHEFVTGGWFQALLCDLLPLCTLDPCEPLIASFREMCTHPCDAVTAQCLLPCQHRSTCSHGIRLAATRCTAAVGGAPRSASCKLRPASANRRRQCSLRCTLSSSQPATGSTIAVYSASCPRHSRPRGTGARFAQHADGSEPRVAVNVPGNETTLRLRLSFGGCARAGLRTVPRVHHRALCALAKRWSPAWICTQSTCQRSAGGPCRWTGTAVVGLCIASWLRCITSDPGRVDTSNVQGWLQVHPSDDGLYLPKRCSTCQHARPARSKHCGTCGMCIARHDHHCGWIHNCVGARNLRWFLLFIASNGFMLTYGSLLAFASLLGHMNQADMWSWRVRHPKDGALWRLSAVCVAALAGT